MTRSILMVGAAMLIAGPAQAGGLLGGLTTAPSQASKATAKAGTSATGMTTETGVRAKVRAGPALGFGGLRGHGLTGVRASTRAALAGSVRALGHESSGKMAGKLGVATGLAGKVHGKAASSVRANLGTVGLAGRVNGLTANTGVKAGAKLRVGLAGSVHGLGRAAPAGQSLEAVKVGTAGSRLATVKVGGAHDLATVRIGSGSGKLAAVRIGNAGKSGPAVSVRVGAAGKGNANGHGKLLAVRVGGTSNANSLASVKIGGTSGDRLATVRIGAGKNTGSTKLAVGELASAKVRASGNGRTKVAAAVLGPGASNPARLKTSLSAGAALGLTGSGSGPGRIGSADKGRQGSAPPSKPAGSAQEQSPGGSGSAGRSMGGGRGGDNNFRACANDTHQSKSGIACNAN